MGADYAQFWGWGGVGEGHMDLVGLGRIKSDKVG